MTNSYDPVILPPIYSYGFSGGPSFDTRVIRMDGGGEQRVQIQQEPVWRWSATRENVSAINGADPDGIRDWFLARRGALYGFLFVDPIDYSTSGSNTGTPSAADEIIGYGDGTTTVFPFRKTYSDPGGLSGRRFSRRIVPLTGSADAATAALLGVAEGTDLSPEVAVGGATVSHTVSQGRGEVRFATAPASGVAITAGCYFCVPVRFSESTDQGLDIQIDSFEGSSVSFEIISIPFDDPAPVVVGGSPYGYQEVSMGASGDVVQLDGNEAFFYHVTTTSATATDNKVYLPESSSYPTGGPHFRVRVSGAGSVTFYQSGGAVAATVASGDIADVFIREDSSNAREPVVISTGVS
jgi:uncharacterized protein (TIGR02217 family)